MEERKINSEENLDAIIDAAAKVNFDDFEVVAPSLDDKLPPLDIEPYDLAVKIIKILDEKKARGITLLHVEAQTILADYFIICSGTSNTQLKSLAGEIEFKLGEENIPLRHMDGYTEASWIVQDFGPVIVHIFNRETRDFYNLEKLWADATEVDIKSIITED